MWERDAGDFYAPKDKASPSMEDFSLAARNTGTEVYLDLSATGQCKTVNAILYRCDPMFPEATITPNGPSHNYSWQAKNCTLRTDGSCSCANGESQSGSLAGAVCPTDADGDGHYAKGQIGCGPCQDCAPCDDCDDADAQVFPGHDEICNNGKDDNCNGAIDERDTCVCDAQIREYCLGQPGVIWHEEPYCWCETCPIIISTSGNDIELSSPETGVYFDLDGDGERERISWTKAGRDDGFLVLDKNENGTIDNGREVFGNRFVTPSGEEGINGFQALNAYDRVTAGGNDDGIISAADAIYSSLRIWIDSNHDGESQPNELIPLSDVGIEWIDLRYRESMRQDQYGNLFHYRSKVHFYDHREKFCYDVFLIGSVK